MKPRQIELVQETWAQVAPRADEAGRLFYGGDLEALRRPA
jgi:hypothetical protein